MCLLAASRTGTYALPLWLTSGWCGVEVPAIAADSLPVSVSLHKGPHTQGAPTHVLCTHTHILTCIQTLFFTKVRVHTHMHTHTHTHLFLHIDTHIHIQTHNHTLLFLLIDTYAHTHTHTHTHTLVSSHWYTHTHTNTCTHSHTRVPGWVIPVVGTRGQSEPVWLRSRTLLIVLGAFSQFN